MKLGSEFRRLWIGNAFSNLSDGITFIAIPLLAVVITKDPLAVAGLSVAYAIPRIIAVLGIGVLLDRVDRRPILYLANYARALMFAVLTVLVALDAANLWVLYVVYALIGVIETLSDSAVFAIVPQAVPSKSLLVRANSRIAGTQVVVDEFVGPPIGGALFAIAAFTPTGVNVVVLLISATAFFLLRGNYRPPIVESVARRSVFLELKDAAVWTTGHAIIRTLIVVGTLASVAYMIPFSFLVLYADQILGLNAAGYGLLLSFSAVGGIAGSWLAGKLQRRLGYGWTIFGVLMLGAGSFAVIGWSTNVVVVALALAAYIFHAVVWGILASSLRQHFTPDSMLGRVGSLSRLLSLIGLALGALLGGGLAVAFGLQVPFYAAGALFVLAALVVLRAILPLSEWERLPIEPASA